MGNKKCKCAWCCLHTVNDLSEVHTENENKQQENIAIPCPTTVLPFHSIVLPCPPSVTQHKYCVTQPNYFVTHPYILSCTALLLFSAPTIMLLIIINECLKNMVICYPNHVSHIFVVCLNTKMLRFNFKTNLNKEARWKIYLIQLFNEIFK